MDFTVDKVNACEPVNRLLKKLLEKGFTIEESRISDFHFNELYFLLKAGSGDANLDDINVEGIKKHSQNKFYCECHWSVVEMS